VVEADNPGQVCSYRVEVVGGERSSLLVQISQLQQFVNVQIELLVGSSRDDFWFSHEGTGEDPLLLPNKLADGLTTTCSTPTRLSSFL